MRFLLLITIIVLARLSLIACQPATIKDKLPEKLPNIIFYLSDDQDKLDYGCYGNDKVHTPAVDRLALEGMLFTNTFTSQAVCTPSRSTLYTGKYPVKNGAFVNHIRVKGDQISLAQRMRESGYKVILAGKSHVAPDTVFKWDHYFKPEKKDGPRSYLPLGKIKDYFEKADGPFCMFITSEYPHGPYFEVEGKSIGDFKFHPYINRDKSDSLLIKQFSGYYRNIEEDNMQLEKVLDLVDKYLNKNTIFIYSADHGTSGKWSLYDRGLNVPFIVRWPGVVIAKSSSDVMIHYADVLPTFIEIAGGKVPEDIDGKSFLPVLKGSKSEIHDYIFGVNTLQGVERAYVFPSRMVRTKKYKYIRNFNSIEVYQKNLTGVDRIDYFIKEGAEHYKNTPFEELYDIINDPYEKNNLASNPELKKIKEELTNRLYSWMEEQGDFLVKDGYMPILKPTQHRLDNNSKFKFVPAQYRDILKPEDYLIFHY
jgi:arylsulfatase A-like enzyme